MPLHYGQVQVNLPKNSALASSTIPQRQLWEQTSAPPPNLVNSAVNAATVLADVGLMAGTEMSPATGFAAGAKFTSDLANLANATGVTQQAATGANSAAQAAATSAAQAASNTSALPSGVGSQNPETYALEVADAVWAYVDEDSTMPTVLVELREAGWQSWYALNNALQRWFTSCNFLSLLNADFQGTDLQPGANLNLASEQARLNQNETDLEMLNRLYPDYSWTENYEGLSMVGASIEGPDGLPRQYWYSPPPPSLNQIWHLWDYTPSSGPPVRNGIADYIAILALLPVQW